jgi:hypothetical protein
MPDALVSLAAEGSGAMSNEQPGTSNEEPVTSNQQRVTSNE